MKILLIEDDLALNASLKNFLTQELFQVESGQSFKEALNFEPRHFDVIILDGNLGDGQGLDLLKKWRSLKIQTPIIFLTAKADLSDKVLGLESGAQDYITKPFEPRELLARIRVQLRMSPKSEDALQVSSLEILKSERKVSFNKTILILSKTEYELLLFLAENANQVFSREELLKNVWGYDRMPTTRTVDTHILQLRQKTNDELFETIHGIGYRLKSKK